MRIRGGWREIGETEAAKVVAVTADNLGAILTAHSLAAHKEGKS